MLTRRAALESMLAAASAGLAGAATGAQQRTVQVDAAKVVGTIRSLQGVGGAPIPAGQAFDVTRQYRDLTHAAPRHSV